MPLELAGQSEFLDVSIDNVGNERLVHRAYHTETEGTTNAKRSLFVTENLNRLPPRPRILNRRLYVWAAISWRCSVEKHS